MLELDSPAWAEYRHAYGDASDVPALLAKLRAAAAHEWDEAFGDFSNTLMHQGDVYTATYAVAPHVLAYAIEIGPGKQSDELLSFIGGAANVRPWGENCPEELEEAWDDAQDEARELILERLLSAEVSKEYTGYLIASLLYLSGEWSMGSVVENWCIGYSLVARCPNCDTEQEVFWHEGAPMRVTPKNTFEAVAVQPATLDVAALDEDMEFDDDEMPLQIISLAAASRHAVVEQQMRSLFGTVACEQCGASLPFQSSNDE